MGHDAAGVRCHRILNAATGAVHIPAGRLTGGIEGRGPPFWSPGSHIYPDEPNGRRKRARSVQSLDNRHIGDTAAFAHGLEAEALAVEVEGVDEGGHKLRAARTERVTESNRAAVDVQSAGVCVLLLEPR